MHGNEPAIAKARAAVNEKASNAKALIEGLPSSAHQDAGVLFSRIQLLRRANKIAEAAELMLSAPHEGAQIYDPDEWWVERRLLARKLLDTNAAPKAYRIVRDRSSVLRSPHGGCVFTFRQTTPGPPGISKILLELPHPIARRRPFIRRYCSFQPATSSAHGPALN